MKSKNKFFFCLFGFVFVFIFAIFPFLENNKFVSAANEPFFEVYSVNPINDYGDYYKGDLDLFYSYSVADAGANWRLFRSYSVRFTGYDKLLSFYSTNNFLYFYVANWEHMYFYTTDSSTSPDGDAYHVLLRSYRESRIYGDTKHDFYLTNVDFDAGEDSLSLNRHNLYTAIRLFDSYKPYWFDGDNIITFAYCSYYDKDVFSLSSGIEAIGAQSEYDLSIDVIYSNSNNPFLFGALSDNIVSYENGYLEGQADGYEDGFIAGQSSSSNFATSWFVSILTGFGSIFMIEIFPNFYLAYVIGLPLIFMLFYWVVGLLKGGDR